MLTSELVKLYNSFTYRSIIFWNSLDRVTRHASSISCFISHYLVAILAHVHVFIHNLLIIPFVYNVNLHIVSSPSQKTLLTTYLSIYPLSTSSHFYFMSPYSFLFYTFFLNINFIVNSVFTIFPPCTGLFLMISRLLSVFSSWNLDAHLF